MKLNKIKLLRVTNSVVDNRLGTHFLVTNIKLKKFRKYNINEKPVGDVKFQKI